MSSPLITESQGNWRPIFWLTLPVLAEETLTLMVTWTDWWLTGQYLVEDGDAVKAAMGLMAYTMWLIPSLFAAVAIGATAVIARRVGGGHRRVARQVANQAVMSGIILAGLITLATAGWGPAYIEVMQLRGGAAEYAAEYLAIVLPVIPLIMLEQVGAACLRGAGDMVTGFVVKSIVVVINMVVSFCLVTGFGGIEPWGWQGIAMGTAVGHGAGGTIMLLALWRGRYGLGLHVRLMRPRMSIIRQIMKIGIPGGMDVAVLLFSNLVFVAIVNSLGTAAAAAHGLGVQLEACAFLPANAFAVAAATLTGQYLGAGRPRRATHAAVACIGLAVLVVSVVAVLIYFGAVDFVTFFTNQPDSPTTIQVVHLLRIVVFALPSLAIIMVTTGALRGAGDTIWPLLFTISGFALIRIPLAVWMSMDVVHIPGTDWSLRGLGWGVEGAWIAMALDLVIRSLMVLVRFGHGGWKHKNV